MDPLEDGVVGVSGSGIHRVPEDVDVDEADDATLGFWGAIIGAAVTAGGKFGEKYMEQRAMRKSAKKQRDFERSMAARMFKEQFDVSQLRRAGGCFAPEKLQ